ncbi:MAG: hypothetical protein AAF310_05715 [Myxococcota bacterium]
MSMHAVIVGEIAANVKWVVFESHERRKRKTIGRGVEFANVLLELLREVSANGFGDRKIVFCGDLLC